MKNIIYAVDGGVAVVVPAPDCGLTVEEIAAKDVPQGAAFEIIEASALPADRVFRNTWEKQGAAVVESLPKSKAIAHEIRRSDRAKKLAPLDIQATIPSQAVAAEAARQVIRNDNAALQLRLDAAASPAALRAELAGLV